MCSKEKKEDEGRMKRGGRKLSPGNSRETLRGTYFYNVDVDNICVRAMQARTYGMWTGFSMGDLRPFMQ